MRALVFTCCFLLGTAQAAPVEIKKQFLDGSLTLIVDDSRIDVAALKRYLVIHPIAYDNEYYLGVQLALCIANDPAYSPCGTRDIHAKNFFTNAASNLQRTKQRLAYLSELREFPELQPLVDYYRSSLQFRIWVDERLLDYFQTRNPAALEQNFNILPVANEARTVLDKLKSATDIDSQWKLSYYEWHNIANNLYRHTEGVVPSDVWAKFVKQRKIVESIEYEEGED